MNGWEDNGKGWVKTRPGKGRTPGYFRTGKMPKTLRDEMNRPLVWNGNEWVLDTAKWIEEVNAGTWKKEG